MTTDRDLALVKAALEAAAKWITMCYGKMPANRMLDDCDPATIAATVEESDPLPAMIEAQREVVRWQSLCGDLFQVSHRDAKRITELEKELAALRSMVRDLCMGHPDNCDCRYCAAVFRKEITNDQDKGS